jgi:phosphoribosylformylglycinamidine cyclo-ligase
VLPEGLAAEFDANTWPLPPVFGWLMRTGGVAEAEMVRVFNCGLGMVAVVAPEDAEPLAALLTAHGEAVYRVGRIHERAAGAPGSVIEAMESAWRA